MKREQKQPVAVQIISYMEAHLKEDLSLERLSKELHYSKFYLSRSFKEQTGQTPYQYIQGRRLEEAARRLENTKEPIVEIALEAGYSSQQAFTKSFRGKYHQTPQEYRKRKGWMQSQAEGRLAA